MTMNKRMLSSTAAVYAPDGGPVAGGETTVVAGDAAAPWAGVADGETWKIGDKPWYDVAVTDPGERELIQKKGYRHPGEVVKAYNNANKLVSDERAVILPDANATPEQLSEFYTKTGRPPSQDDYDLKVDPSVQIDENMMKFGKSLFFELGLDNKRAQAAVDRWNGQLAEMAKGAEEKWQADNDKAVAALQTNYTGDFTADVKAGTDVVNALGLAPEALAAIERAIGGAPMVELFMKLGQKSKEPGAFLGGGPGPADPKNMTSDQASARLNAMSEDAEIQKALNDATHKDHARYVNEQLELYKRV
jgi:hypothetical protein